MPLVPKLKDGELAVVLSWSTGNTATGNNVELQDLDLHIEFEASETIMCNVDFTMRQCNGVKLTTDSLITENKIT